MKRAVRQVIELVVGRGKEAAEDDRHRLLITGECNFGRLWHLGDGITDPDIREFLDVGDDVADLPHAQLVAGDLARPESTQACDLDIPSPRP